MILFSPADAPVEVLGPLQITVAFGPSEGRYLVNISLHQGSSLICAAQIFSHLDWLKMGEKCGGGVVSSTG